MSWRHIGEHGKEALQHIRGRMDGTIKSIPTPWKRYNDVGIDGIEFNSITLVAAVSAGGKTAFANQLAFYGLDNAPELDHCVLDFNFEMLGKNLVMRAVSGAKDMNMQKIQSAAGYRLEEEEFADIQNYIDTILSKRRYYVVDEPASVAGVEEDVMAFYKAFGKKFLASFDHSILTKRTASENSMLEMLQNLGVMLTRVKKRIPIAWLILSQLNREIEAAERKLNGSSAAYPVRSDIYGGDALYQHADIVTVIHRPFLFGIAVYGPKKIPVDKDSLFFHNLKVRNGDSNILEMRANFKRMRILDPTEEGQLKLF